MSILLIPTLNQQDIVSFKVLSLTFQHGLNLKLCPKTHILIVDACRELTCSLQQDLQQKANIR